MGVFIQDVRFALRMLRKARGAGAVAILSLALGIGVNTTVFSWVRGILLNPVPGVSLGDRLVTIETVTPSGEMIDASYPDFRDYRDRSQLLDGVVAFKERPLGFAAGGPGDSGAEVTRTERVWALMVSGNYFDGLGVKPALGRFFAGEEQRDTFDAAPVAVLSDALWKSRFNADPGIAGRTIRLNRRSYTVIGVAPEFFYGTITGLRFDLYVPLTMQSSLTGSSQWLSVRSARPLYLFARLEPGVTIDQGRAEVRSIASALEREFPRTNSGLSATMLPLSSARRGAQSDLGPLLHILLALGAFVLLIVCANLTNLQLARATTRQREIAVRLGLGAPRSRLVRQLLTESLVIACLSGAAALLLTSWMVDFLRVLVPFVEYPIVLASGVGAREVAFATAASIVSALLIGLMPALRLSAGNIAETLKTGGRQAAGDSRTGRVRVGLVVGEVALAMVALVSAGLLVRSFENVRRVYPGFEPRGVLLAGVNLSTGGYDRDRGLLYMAEARRRLSTLPGVVGVTVAEDVPLGFNGGSWEDISVAGYVPAQNENMKLYRNLIAPGYFGVMQIGLLEGRDFTDEDRAPTMPVAIVNQEFARRYFDARSPVGRQFTAWGRPITIVGMVETTRYHSLSERAQPYFYVPLAQRFGAGTGVALHVRAADVGGTGSDHAAISAVTASVRRELQAIDPAMPPPLTVTLADYIGAAYFSQRTAALLLGVLAVLALTLASVGLYSLVAFGVSTRRQEIGVRMALGAASSDIMRLILAEGARMAAAGVVAGVILALAGTRALESLLFGVSPIDLPTLGAAALLLAAVAVAASYVPARSAARTDPMLALRAE
jgi:putative ABC transport system permease protein